MESLLKKEFREKDLQRARNLITGKYSDSTQTLVGFTGRPEEEHKEGEVWTDSTGKSWTIEDGIRVSVSKLQRARTLAKIPLACPKCGKAMNTRLDKKMYPIHKMCFDCVTKLEDDLRRAGLYKQYEESMLAGNIKGFVSDLLARLDFMKANTKVGILAGEGTVENWGKVPDYVITSLEDWCKVLRDRTL